MEHHGEFIGGYDPLVRRRIVAPYLFGLNDAWHDCRHRAVEGHLGWIFGQVGVGFIGGFGDAGERAGFLHLTSVRCGMFAAMLEKLLTDGVHVFDPEAEQDGPNGLRISVIAEIWAKAGHEEEVRVILHELVRPSLAESGCSVYHLLEDKGRPGSFATYEEWENVAALKRHLAGDSAKAALAKAQPMLDGEMKLRVFRKLL